MINREQETMLKRAEKEARSMGNDYVGSEHILLALLHAGEGKLAKALAAQGVYYFQVREDAMILFGMKEQQKEELQVTAIVEKMIEQGIQLQQRRGMCFEDCMGDVLLTYPSCVAMELLRRYELTVEEIGVTERKGIAILNEQDALRCLNFAEQQSYVGREEQIDLLVEILLRREKANPLLLGEAGVGKSALVEALAQRIEAKEIPALKDHYIYALDINTLVAGTRYRGDFEEKIKKILALFRTYPNAILFIDELHQMIGAGKAEGSIDVASVLKPSLSRREIRCIGATTLDEYERFIEKDPALQRRFQCVVLKEPNKEETMRILQARAKEYSRFHQVEISEELFPSMIRLADYYLPCGRFPDKALDVLDLSCAHAKAHSEGRVDEHCIREVISSLSNIPCCAKERMAHTMEVLRQYKAQFLNDRLEQLLKQLTKETVLGEMLGCWQLCGERNDCRKILQILSEEYFCQPHFLSLDMHAYPFLLEDVIAKLHRNPYTILCIEHFADSFEEVRSLFAMALSQGEIRYGNQRASLRHTLVVFLTQDSCVCAEIADLVEASLYLKSLSQQLLS